MIDSLPAYTGPGYMGRGQDISVFVLSFQQGTTSTNHVKLVKILTPQPKPDLPL